MRRCARCTLLLAVMALAGVASVPDAKAGCVPLPPTAGADVIVCDAGTPPNPTGALNFLGGGDTVTVNSGTYGSFTFPSGANTLIFGSGGGNPALNGTILFGAGADRMEVHSGTITGNVDQGSGIDTFIMTGGQIIGNLEQSADRDIFFMSGGVITGAFIEGDVITITGGSIGSVNMNIGNNIFNMSGGTVVGDVIGFGNDDTFILSGGSIGGNVNLGNGDNSATVTGGQIGNGLTTGTGTDVFSWNGGGTISGAINLGAGTDTATLSNLTSAIMAATTLLDGGAGTDTLTFNNTEATGVGRFQNWETVSLTNATRLTLDGSLVLGDVGTLTGALSIDATSTLLAGAGVNPSIASFAAGQLVTVTNAGLIDLTNGASGATDSLTILGNYIGTGGRLALQTVLGTDGSPTDTLVISGAGATASGSTAIAVTNLGGAGALTTADGIAVVIAQGGATTQAGAFSLAGPVAAGPFEYLLFKGGVSGGSQDNWFLRSTLVAPPLLPQPAPTPAPGTPPLPPAPPPGSPPIPLYRPEVAVHSVVPAVARSLGLVTLGTYHERVGGENQQPGSRAWGRLFGQHIEQQFSGTVRPDFQGTLAGFQTGLDLWRLAGAGHRDHAGVYAAYAQANGNVRGFAIGLENAAAGKVSLDATSFGAYWTHMGPTGWYLDGVLQASVLDGDPRSHRGVGAHVSGNAFAASLEGGYPIPIMAGLILESQAQAIWQHLSLDGTSDRFSTIAFDTSDGFTGRLGARLQGKLPTATALLLPYLKTNVWWNAAGTDTISFAATPVTATSRGAAVEVGGGVTARLGPAVSLFGEASYLTSIDGQDVETVRGTVGLRWSW